MKTPFPWFGGKSQVASVVWERLGDVRNYIEPFFGGGAVLLNRPITHTGRIETINDIDAFLCNFWRAAKYDPDGVTEAADWPVNEIDLMARRDWLFTHKDYVTKMMRDPDWYDTKLAGVWLWGVCSTIGGAWKEKSTPLGDAGRGIHRAGAHLGNAGRGIHRAGAHLGDAGRGIHRAGAHLGDAGRGAYITTMMQQIQARLDGVRVMCGCWDRVTSPTVTTHNGLTGMFLDPPYIDKCSKVYNENTNDVRSEIFEYCIANGSEIRIALCCYEGEHNMPDDWECYRWKTAGGYCTSSSRATENRNRETIYFSPACIKQNLF